jgi:hypothetical protein
MPDEQPYRRRDLASMKRSIGMRTEQESNPSAQSITLNIRGLLPEYVTLGWNLVGA